MNKARKNAILSLLLLLVLSGSLQSSAAQSNKPVARELVAKGAALVKTEKINQAIPFFLLATRADAGSLKAYEYLAYCPTWL